MASEFDTPSPAALAQRKKLFFAAAGLVCFSVPVDWMVAQAFPARSIAIRVIWALLLSAVGLQLTRTSVDTGRRWVRVAAALSPLFYGSILLARGGTGSPIYSYLAVMPLGVMVVAPEEVAAVSLAAVVSVLTSMGVIALSGGKHAEVLIWGYLALGAGALAVAVSVMFRRVQRAERAANSARNQALEKLAESERLRAESEKLAGIGRLAAGVAHEINNPLSYICGNLLYLAESDGQRLDPAEYRQVIAETRQGADRIRNIVKELKVFAREDVAGADGCALGPVVDEALATVRAGRPSGPTTQVEIADALPPVRVGRHALAQVLTKLITNAEEAVSALPPGQPRLVRVTAAPAGGGTQLVVEDNGPGIAPEARARLFEPFFSTKGPGRGTGLGLATARDYLTRYGGKVSGENRPEGGARFVVWLPPAQPRPAP